MGQPGKEQMLRGSAVLLSKALLASFCFALETDVLPQYNLPSTGFFHCLP